jgi:uncharacterized protein
MLKKILAIAFLLLLPLAPAASPVWAADVVHKLALQVSDNDADKMNVSKYYAEKSEDVQIEIVAFNAGLHMLREDTSPVKERLQSFAQSMPNVAFRACNNTLEAMTRKEGKKPGIVANATLVPAGVITLMELANKGWVIIRP